MSEMCRHIELRHEGLGVTAAWDGGVTAVLRDDAAGRVLSRAPIGDGAAAADVEVALRALIRREADRRRTATLIERARAAVQRGWALSGTASALVERSRALGRWRSRQRWTELEGADRERDSA